MDWRDKTAAEQGRAIGMGALDPVELADVYLEAAAAHPLRDRIYARLTAPRARAEAEAARARARTGTRRGPLDGVPISWKDLFDTAGVATEAGSALLEGRMPTQDAEVLAAATAQGLVCLGKTHMSELAFSGLGYNPITATSPCVHDPDCVSGGSSSGAAASVAHRLAAAGIGTDTGGSVRIPAAWNDLVGLKTTAGRVSNAGVVPLCARFDTVGPLTRSVEDAALLLAALEGRRPADLHGAGLSGARLLVLESIVFDDIEEAPGAAFETAAARLSAAGAVLERAPSAEIEEAFSFALSLYTAEAYGLWRDEIEATPEKMFPEILERFRLGAGVSAADYVAGWARLTRLRQAFFAATAGYDAVIMPSCPILPPQIARLGTDHDYYVSRNLYTLRNTRVANLMGAASLTLPTGVPSCGLMLMVPPMQEERLLRLGAAAERALAAA
ncbi:MAG: amidase family protein [Pseudomonadota bacterium]